MGFLGILLLVVFVISCILLILMVLIQNEEGDSLGGLFAGGSNSAFGSRSGNVLTKTTYILGTIFLVTTFALALVNRTPKDTGVEAAAQQLKTEVDSDWWVDEANTDELEAPAAPLGESAPAAE